MPGDLPRTYRGRQALVTRRKWRLGVALALGSFALLTGPLSAAAELGASEGAVPAVALQKLDEMRRAAGCVVSPTDDVGQELTIRGRRSVEIKGRERGGDAAGTMRDLAVFDLAVGRIVSYVCFTNASTRKSGEAIVSLVEISSRGDKVARALLPGFNLELEGAKRHRASGTESVYYEARYTSPGGEFPFFDPPVRLLLNATTGSLFRLDIEPDWLDPVEPPRARISRKAAERIATVMLRSHDLTPAFGPDAVFKVVATAEMFRVRGNDWLGFFKEDPDARARVSWIVPFRVDGAAAAGLHSLFVDAETGLVIGGLSGTAVGQQSR